MSPDSEHDPHLSRDIGHSLAVATLACVATAGLLYVAYLGHTLWVAMRSAHRTDDGDYLLVFGKRLQDRRPDPDFQQRLTHARRLAEHNPERPLILLGGGEPGASEAEVGLRTLRDMGLPERVPVLLEDRSLDTLQNLRNARQLLAQRAPGPVLLLSNRYHLARCAMLATALGFDYRLCAAEERFQPTPGTLTRLAAEAGYLCWLDVGTRWARLIGHQRMLRRVS